MNTLKTYQEVLSMDPDELQNWLEEFIVQIPTSIETVEDMHLASKQLSTLASNFTYLNSLSVYAKNAVRREKKKGKENKEMADVMIDRQNAINSACDSLKLLYSCLSRLITIKQEINRIICLLWNKWHA